MKKQYSQQTSCHNQKKIKKEKNQSKNSKGSKQQTLHANFKISDKIIRDFWTTEEDSLLLKLYEEFGKQWSKLASIMKNRTRKQIRDRYLNALRPDINYAPWTEEEEKLLVELHEALGNKWTLIASKLKGRTENQVKNKFYWTKRRFAIIPSPSTQASELDSNSEKEEFIEASINLEEIYPEENDIDRFLWSSKPHLLTQSAWIQITKIVSEM